MSFLLAAWGFIKPALAMLRLRWREALVVLALMVFAWAWFRGEHYRHGEARAKAALASLVAQEKAAAVRTKAVVKAQGAISVAAESHEAAAQDRIRTVTRTIIREVPTYVTAQTDARYPLPVGLVRVYDASALGLDVSAVPLGPGQSDDQASAVKASDAAVILAGNNGQCIANAERLTALQDWITAQQAAFAR